MMWATSSGSGNGSAVFGRVSMTGSLGVDDRHVEPVELRCQLSDGDGRCRRGVGEHELDPCRRQRRVDRQIRRTGFEDRQDRHNRLGGSRKQQRHTLTRARTPIDQQMRQPIRRLIKLAIGQRPALTDHRHRVRRTRHLSHKQCRHRHLGYRLNQHRPITPPIQPGTLHLIQQIHRRQRPCRIGCHHREHSLEPLDQCLDTGRVEHVGVVFDAQPHLWARLSLHGQRVVRRLLGGDVGDGELVIALRHTGFDRVVLVCEERVEKGVLTDCTVNFVERQVLVLERVVIGTL